MTDLNSIEVETSGNHYQALLFDADDTLLDFQANERESLTTLFRKLKLPLNNQIRQLYSTINTGLWHRYEQGTISQERLVNLRFELLFQQLGIEADPTGSEHIYRRCLDKGIQLIPGALEVCRHLSASYPLYVVTNGASATQSYRLTASGLMPFLKGVFISEEIGAQKPMPAFFDNIFARLPGLSRRMTLIIGDSLSSDIAGGAAAGIDTCWLNPEGRPCGTVKPTFQIKHLEDLEHLLL